MLAPLKGKPVRRRESYLLEYLLWRWEQAGKQPFHILLDEVCRIMKMTYPQYKWSRDKLAMASIVRVQFRGIRPRSVFVEVLEEKIEEFFYEDEKIPKPIYNEDLSKYEKWEDERVRNMQRDKKDVKEKKLEEKREKETDILGALEL